DRDPDAPDALGTDNRDENNEIIYNTYRMEGDANGGPLKSINDGESILHPSKELLEELMNGAAQSSSATSGACSERLSKYLADACKMTDTLVLDPQGRSLKTLEGLEKNEDVDVDGKMLAQWAAGIDVLYDKMKSHIEEATKWGDMMDMGVECNIKTEWFEVRGSDDSAQYNLQLRRDRSLQGCYQRQQEDTSVCESIEIPLLHEGLVPESGDVTDEGEAETCRAKLVRSLKSLKAHFYKQAEEYTEHLFPLLSKQLDIESQNVWKVDEGGPNHYSVETTSSTAIIIANAVTKNAGDEGWRFFKPSQPIAPFCSLKLDESKDEPHVPQMDIDQGFQLTKVVTPAAKTYDTERIREDIKAYFPSPAIKEDMKIESTDSLCKAALFDYLLAVESYARANGSIPLPDSSPTVDDMKLIENAGKPREYVVKKDSVLGKMFVLFEGFCEDREMVPVYQEAWDNPENPVNRLLQEIQGKKS
ncbi:hypothetical protein FOL47_001389, partial [Perkinsus chesapeaki]